MDEDLIERLARDLKPADPRRPLRRFAVAAAVAVALAFGAFFLLPDIAIRSDLASALLGAAFWVKLAFTLALAGVGGWAMTALARPGRRDPGGLKYAGLVWTGFAVLALAALATTPPADWRALIMGDTIQRCLSHILIFSAPLLALLLLAMRRAAPTQLTRAGWACGLAAGGLAAAVYSLGCDEASPVFLVLWYGLGVAIAATAGALAGRFVLRW